jgi:hypothetical protein
MLNLAVRIATTKLQKLKTAAASAVTFSSTEDSTTNASSKYGFAPSSTARSPEVRLCMQMLITFFTTAHHRYLSQATPSHNTTKHQT